jgi:hypothetical protein
MSSGGPSGVGPDRLRNAVTAEDLALYGEPLEVQRRQRGPRCEGGCGAPVADAGWDAAPEVSARPLARFARLCYPAPVCRNSSGWSHWQMKLSTR